MTIVNEERHGLYEYPASGLEPVEGAQCSTESLGFVAFSTDQLRDRQVMITQGEILSNFEDNLEVIIMSGGLLLATEYCLVEMTEQIDEVIRLHDALDRKNGAGKNAVKNVGVISTETYLQLKSGIGGSISVLEQEDVDNSSSEAAVMLKVVFSKALKLKASDIHYRIGPTVAEVYYRVDGDLTDTDTYPYSALKALDSRLLFNHSDYRAGFNSVSERIKCRLELNVENEQGLVIPIEGRYQRQQVETGTKTVIRIQDSNGQVKTLEEWGYPAEFITVVDKHIHKPHGAIIVSGPTGSGKTNLLAAAMDRIRDGRQRISVEDPVEIVIPGVDQTSVNDKLEGDSFHEALLASLRQDPDVASVGEVRDRVTAGPMITYARTGHLLLTTMHVNNAWEIPLRLTDMSIETHEFRGTLSLLVGQRLLPRLCEKCSVRCEDVETRKLLLRTFPDISNLRLRNPVGCESCSKGKKGRVACVEAIEVLDSDYDFFDSRDVLGFQRALKDRGVRLMADHAQDLVSRGLVDPFDANRIVKGALNE